MARFTDIHPPDRAPTLIAVVGDLWVIDKPADYLVHPAGNEAMPDILAWARAVHGAPATLAPAHRLDRQTSGVVLCSPDADLRTRLGVAFASREVRKTYHTLVHDLTPPAGVIDRALADGRRGAPLDARTRYVRLEAVGRFSYLEVTPETGRKHQIRRHLNHIGHGIVGDRRYPHKKPRRMVDAPARLWLHALRVALPDGQVFEAPLAPELAAHLARLRRAG
ncbi:MAG: RNA pseudouridine synthase [Deltaproteobacteria bacterium]|nr:MAG: RNA pseudouridine synthase [Deltaproteobacteria bacterium]